METCSDCGHTLENGVCLNIDCETARRQATTGAARQTAKAGAPMTVGPAAYTVSGRVD